MILRYLNGSHRPREVAPRGHPIPQPVEVVHLVGCEIVDAHSVHARRCTVRSDLLPRLENETLRNFKRLQLLLPRSICRLLPRTVDLQTTLNCPAPSLRPHYRALTATTGRSAPVPRIGTLALAASAACGSPSCGQQHRPSLSGRQVLLFCASACDELTPPIHRAPSGPHTGSSPTEGPPRRAFVPGPPTDPSFDAIVISFRCVSSGSHMFVFSSHTRPANSETSTAALTTPALDRRSLRWFGISACTATPQDLPPSLAQHGSCRRSSTSSSLPFRTHVGARNRVVGGQAAHSLTVPGMQTHHAWSAHTTTFWAPTPERSAPSTRRHGATAPTPGGVWRTNTSTGRIAALCRSAQPRNGPGERRYRPSSSPAVELGCDYL